MEQNTKKILQEIISAQDDVTANNIVAKLQESFAVADKNTQLASAACVGVACNNVTNCTADKSECSPYACNTFGGSDHDCRPVACGTVHCGTMGNYA
jgi:hypothetical protein